MKSEKPNIKKIIKKRIELKKQTKMGVRDKLRITGTPSKVVPVGLISRNDIRQGKNYMINKNELLEFDFSVDGLGDDTVSIIFSYKESSHERRRNLQNILNFFSKYLSENLEIILVEQDSENRITWLQEIENYKYIKHIFLKNNKIFNKGRGFNVGAKHANGNCLIFNDSDVMVSPKTYEKSILLLDEFDVVNPYKYLYWLNELETIEFISAENKSKIELYRKKFPPSVISGGIFLIKKEQYLKLKGFDENSFGWGFQDYIFDEKLKKIGLTITTVESIALHLHHEGSSKPGVNNVASDDKYFSFKERNKAIYDTYKEMTGEQILNKIKHLKKFGEGGVIL